MDWPVPIFLFQSGHGSSAKSHALLLKKIANEGFVVVVPEHPNDTGSGDLGRPPNKSAAAAVFAGSTIAELQTDGTHLEAALEWATSQRGGIIHGHGGPQRVDCRNIVTGGFSAGCLEAINHVANSIHSASISGMVCIAPSTAEFVEIPYKFKRRDIKAKIKALTIPTLWITSEEDLTNFEALDMFKDVNTVGTTLVSFKDDILDVSMKLAEEFSIWGIEMAKQNPGLAQHMALACAEDVVAAVPIASFMKRLFGASIEQAGPFVADESMAVVVTKTADNIRGYPSSCWRNNSSNCAISSYSQK